VAEGLQDHEWTRGLQRIASTQEINQFVELWQKVSAVTLSPLEGGISWRFSANGMYSSRSAYAIQFLGRLLLVPIMARQGRKQSQIFLLVSDSELVVDCSA
jgi:hypothetical protein